MPGLRFSPTLWRRLRAARRRARSRSASGPYVRSEFHRINQVAGREPLHPELSGLQLRPVRAPGRLHALLIQLRYRWHPSMHHYRRQTEMRVLNGMLRNGARDSRNVPPILTYPEQTEVAPTRLQPMPGHQRAADRFAPRESYRDLRDLEEDALRGAPLVIAPRLPHTDPAYLQKDRPLLPRQYREFLRTSPYPRAAVVLAATVTAISGWSWITSLERTEAVAAGRAHTAQSRVETEIEEARSYGVEPRALATLEREARQFAARTAPDTALPSHARASYFVRQTRDYSLLLGAIRRLEHRAWSYWTWREGTVYAGLLDAGDGARRLGLPIRIEHIPACATPACFRTAVKRQVPYTRWLGETASTLRVYAARISAAPDPVAATGTVLQTAHALRSLLPALKYQPIDPATLDARAAMASTPAEAARAGALAHLEVDALHAALIRSLPRRAIVVSLEDESLTGYLNGHTVLHTAIVAGPSAPYGRFHITAKEPSLPATFWSRARGSYLYRYGALTDWMAFTGGCALQAAPWRAAFGPGATGAPVGYAPDTPSSIDLPPDAANALYRWAPAGTEVVIS